MTDHFDIEDDENPFEKRPYKVGYGKPPKEHRFKAGNRSAAGKRRRRKDMRLSQLAERLLKEKLTVTIDGKRRRISRLEAIFRTTIQQAAKSPRDALRLLSWVMQHEPEDVPEWVDHKILVELVKRDWSDNPFPGAPPDQIKRSKT